MSARDSLGRAPDDEITLVEMWDILSRRRRWIFAGLLICLLTAAAYLLFKAPVYESNGRLSIGQVAGPKEAASGLLDEPDVLAAWLLGKYGEEIATGVKRPLPYLKRAGVQKGSRQVIELVVHGKTPQESVDFLRKLSEESIARHKEVFDATVEVGRRRIEQISAQRQRLSEILLRFDGLVDALKQKDPVLASVAALERGRIATELSEIDRELPLWEERLSPPRTVMTQMFGEAASPADPVAPKTLLVLALAFALGLGGGIALAFVAEFVAKAKSVKQLGPR